MAIVVRRTDELSGHSLVNIFQERARVFVVEQNCPYLEVDDFDYDALHLVDFQKELRAYCRIIDRGEEVSIGRLFVKKEYRGQGLARDIFSFALTELRRNFPKKPVTIEAQAYLVDFYRSFGFKALGDKYELDGIPHVAMVLDCPKDF